MKLLRLSGRKNVDYLRRKGRVWKGKHMTIRYLPHTPFGKETAGIYVGTMGSTKLHKSAVKRNRMRRRSREALRTYLREHPIKGSFQLLIAPRSSSLTCDYSELRHDAERFLSQF